MKSGDKFFLKGIEWELYDSYYGDGLLMFNEKMGSLPWRDEYEEKIKPVKQKNLTDFGLKYPLK